MISAAVLLGLGWRTLWRGIRARHGLEWPDETEPAHALLTAIAATALNLLTIALWTISATLAWYCGFAAAIALLRRRVRPGLVGYRTLHGER